MGRGGRCAERARAEGWHLEPTTAPRGLLHAEHERGLLGHAKAACVARGPEVSGEPLADPRCPDSRAASPPPLPSGCLTLTPPPTPQGIKVPSSPEPYLLAGSGRLMQHTL